MRIRPLIPLLSALLLMPCLGTAAEVPGEVALVQAARLGDTFLIDQLLTLQESGLELVERCGATALHAAILSESVDAVRMLLAAGADTEALDAEGLTALHHAVDSMNEDIIRLLLQAGASPTSKDSRHAESPVARALRSGNAKAALLMFFPRLGGIHCITKRHQIQQAGGDTEVVRALLAAGVDVDAEDARGRTLLHEAAYGNNAECMRLLLAAKADLNAQDECGRTPLMRIILHYRESHTPDFPCSFSGHYSVFHLADNPARYICLNLLLQCDADVNLPDKYGNSALLLALQGGDAALKEGLGERTHDAALLEKLCQCEAWESEEACRTLIQTLLDYGANPNAKAPGGETPLLYATSLQFGGVVQALLAAGADAAQGNDAGETPVARATRLDWQEGVEILSAASPK